MTPFRGDTLGQPLSSARPKRPIYKLMPALKPIRIATALLLTLPPMLLAQDAQQPPTQPPSAAPRTPGQQPAQRAEVIYANSTISVTAQNSSLNQILRDIAQQTGMKITGGVADERVYGNYGPASPAKVLGQLLDGTGSNMLLLQNSAAIPTELVLTPRNGGPTPPSPAAASGYDDQNYPRGPINRRPPFNPSRTPNLGANIVTAPVSPTPTPPPPVAPATQPSPNGVKTPQQIYDELQRMQQQPQSAPTP